MENYLLLEIIEKIGLIYINRPDKLNALNSFVLKELDILIDNCLNDKNIKIIIITGSGHKAFVAGADIDEINKLDKLTAYNFSKKGQSVFQKIERSKKPIIAAINGFALGGGLELALSCHIRFASENAKLGQPECNLGIIPGFGGTQRLTRIIGKAKAMELILSGEHIPATDAKSLRLVNQVYTSEELLTKTIEFAKKLQNKSSIVLQKDINLINSVDDFNLEMGLELEAKLFSECCNSDDFKEGTTAFLEKRKPIFRE